MNKCPLCGKENPATNRFCNECGYSFSAGQTGQLDPDTLLENRYIIVKTLGRGGMGAVYLALDTSLNNMAVAVKEMSTQAVGGDLQAAIGAFKKEASLLVSLHHPQLPRILDLFPRGEDRWYLVMDYIEGQTLKEVADRRGAIPEEDVLNWARQLGEILEYLHKQNPPIIFHDLKPANIMLTPEGRIKLIDFGIARHFRLESTADTSDYGSGGFAPPEQYAANQTDPRSYIYALGATLHYLLTGQDPGKNPFIFVPPSQTVKVSPWLETAIMKALEINPENRPQSMREMLNLLSGDVVRPASGNIIDIPNPVPTVKIQNASPVDKPGKKAGKTRKIVVAACLLIALISVGVYALNYSRKDIQDSGIIKPVSQEVLNKSEVETAIDDVKQSSEINEPVRQDVINKPEVQAASDDMKQKIIFNDFRLENVIREMISKQDGEIYADDVKDLRELVLNETGIRDISALQYMTNLQKLVLRDCCISDISALRGLNNLQYLELSINEISDISALSGLTNLKSLVLNMNRINDISTLKGLTNLKSLWLSYNRISDISALQGLTNLEILWLVGNKISDISALRGLNKLETLSLSENKISDYSPVKAYYNNIKEKDFNL